MANPVVQQITAELENLQTELTQFKQTTEYLDGAKQHVEKAVKSVNHSEANFEKRVAELKETYNSIVNLKEAIGRTIEKIDTVNFPERLARIESTVGRTIETLNNIRQTTIDELRIASETIIGADFDGRFQKLQQSIDTTVKSNEELKKSIGLELKQLTAELKAELKRIENSINLSLIENRKFIQDLNLPIRMDKLDANISGIMAGIQNTQAMLQTLDRDIGDKLRENYEKQTQAISNLQMQIQQNNDATQKKMQTNAYITWAILAIGAGIVAFWIF